MAARRANVCAEGILLSGCHLAQITLATSYLSSVTQLVDATCQGFDAAGSH
jgi:hypothetical protein